MYLLSFSGEKQHHLPQRDVFLTFSGHHHSSLAKKNFHSNFLLMTSKNCQLLLSPLTSNQSISPVQSAFINIKWRHGQFTCGQFLLIPLRCNCFYWNVVVFVVGSGDGVLVVVVLAVLWLSDFPLWLMFQFCNLPPTAIVWSVSQSVCCWGLMCRPLLMCEHTYICTFSSFVVLVKLIMKINFSKNSTHTQKKRRTATQRNIH